MDNFVCPGVGWGDGGGRGCSMPIFCPILAPLLCEFNKFEFSTGEGGDPRPPPNSDPIYRSVNVNDFFVAILKV